MHVRQVAPLTPHACLSVPALQVPSVAQQPVQVAGSQTHEPPLQVWPTVHAAPVPQPQDPVARQVSARRASHERQRPPGAAHEVAVRGEVQPPSASQHPVAHVVALQPPTQVPAEQVPPLQLVQVPPSEPQAVSAVPGWQVPLRQQPDGQVLLLQVALTHCPAVQVPAPQLMHAAPPVPHAFVAVPATQAPF